jgi:hypothetical protein
MCIKQYFFFKFFNSCKIQLVKLECVLWQLFFQKPHQFWEAPTFAFLISQFGIYKKLLVVTLMPYQKSWNIKAIKCIVIKPQPFELLNIQLPAYLPFFFLFFGPFQSMEMNWPSISCWHLKTHVGLKVNNEWKMEIVFTWVHGKLEIFALGQI